MKVLVTGANGFLGAWLTRRLLEEGHQVKALVREKSDLSELAFCKPEYVFGDVTDNASLNEHFKNVEVVFHLAGVIAYKKSARALMDLVNVQGTQNVIEACQNQNVSKLLYLSSVVAIGASFQPKILNEQSPFDIHQLNLGYFETKHQAEHLVRQAALLNKFHAVCVNPSTIYGFGDAKKGSRKNQIKVARGELGFYTSGGVNVVAVEDVLDGIMLALSRGRNAERYILASENITIKNLFEKIAQAAKVKAPQTRLPNWVLHTMGLSGDLLIQMGFEARFSQENAYTATMFHWFDNAKAQSELGFRPRPADYAIENSVQWMQDQGYLK
jgi:dihydroflavonol-4-reductase